MTNTNGFSDSQESALLEDEVFVQLEKEIGINTLPLLVEEVMEEEIEEKYSAMLAYSEEDRVSREEQQKFDPRYHEPETLVPVKEEFPGPFNFQFLLANQNVSKHLVYSQPLKKVFINMEQVLPLRFKWEPPMDGLNLRTAMVFSLDQYTNDPVRRCHNHMAMALTNGNNQDVDPRLIKHVVHCLDRSSSYEERNEHLSIVTPLRTPQAGSQYVQMCFKFLCKNSCTSGMNRRPTELIFTLENDMGKVLGRRRLAVRVCSCPKRDKEKEEGEVTNAQPGPKKRKLSLPMGKKMMPSCDTHVFNVQLNIVGKENYLSVMKYAYDIMAGQAARTGQFEFFKPYMDDILHKTP